LFPRGRLLLFHVFPLGGRGVSPFVFFFTQLEGARRVSRLLFFFLIIFELCCVEPPFFPLLDSVTFFLFFDYILLIFITAFLLSGFSFFGRGTAVNEFFSRGSSGSCPYFFFLDSRLLPSPSFFPLIFPFFFLRVTSRNRFDDGGFSLAFLHDRELSSFFPLLFFFLPFFGKRVFRYPIFPPVLG